jgi:uncharacterized protein
VRVVLDTNIYLSGIIFGGNCRHVLDLAIKKKFTVVSSPAILLEISQKLEKKFKWKKEQILLIIKTLSKTTLVIEPKIGLDAVKKDKNDNKIIEAGVEGGVEYIISGDKHLLELRKYKGIEILSPAEFLSISFQGN